MNNADRGYGRLAPFYNIYWTKEAPALFEKALNKVLLPSLPVKAEILDLCCGTGQLCARLSQRLYQMTGLDISSEMLSIAAKNAPAAVFSEQDARSFSFDHQFDAVVSFFDSMNHLLAYEDLVGCFKCVRAALKSGGRFLFDVNSLAAFGNSWEDGFTGVEDDSVCIVKPAFDPNMGMSLYTITLFSPEGKLWRREEVQILEKYYTGEQVINALGAADFHTIQVFDGGRDLKIRGFKDRSFCLAE